MSSDILSRILLFSFSLILMILYIVYLFVSDTKAICHHHRHLTPSRLLQPLSLL